MSVQADYDLTPDDLVAFGLCHQQQSRTIRKRSYVSVLVGLLAILFLPTLILLVSDKPLAETALAIWPLLLGLPLFLMLAYLLNRFGGSATYRKILAEGQPKFLDRHTLLLNDDGLHESWPAGISHLHWSAVKQILSTKDHAFVYISAYQALILPRQSFSSDVGFDEFLAEISRQSGSEIREI